MGRGVALVGRDTAGGVHLGGGQSTLSINGALVAVKGDRVAGHGDSPHNNAVMVEGSSWFTWNGIPVVFEGHKASCGHSSTGSVWLTVE